MTIFLSGAAYAAAAAGIWFGARWLVCRARVWWHQTTTAVKERTERSHTDAKWPDVVASWALPDYEREQP